MDEGGGGGESGVGGGTTSDLDYLSPYRLKRIADAAGRVTNITYDDYGNVASVLDENGNGHFFEYDYDGAKSELYARITNSAGMVKEVWYDKDGETRRVDVNGRTIKNIQKDGRNLIVTDENGRITRKEFDEWDNLTKVTYPDGTTRSYEYEHTFNRRIRETDENGIVTRFEYDAAGNMIRKIEAEGSAVRADHGIYLRCRRQPVDHHTPFRRRDCRGNHHHDLRCRRQPGLGIRSRGKHHGLYPRHYGKRPDQAGCRKPALDL